jgi:hypothetical protein
LSTPALAALASAVQMSYSTVARQPLAVRATSSAW